LLLLLAGCGATPQLQPPLAAQFDPDPPFRQIIAKQLDSIFGKDAEMHGVSISRARRGTTPANPDWRVCLRGTSKNIAGGIDTHTYAIFIDRSDKITDRRLAEPDDGCDQERYEPLRVGR
jgi:hypothetical protein